MKRTRLLICSALLAALALASGCSLFGGNDSPAAVTGGVNQAKLAKMIIPVNANADQAVSKAPARAADATTLDFEFYDAKTLSRIQLSGAVDWTTNAGNITVTGEFIGVPVLVKVISKADPTKKKDVLLGTVTDDNAPAVVHTVTSKVAISSEAIVATKVLIEKQAGATADDKIKALGAATTFAVTDDLATPTTNQVVATAQALVDQITSGAINVAGADTTAKLITLLEELTAGTKTVADVTTSVDARLALLHTVTGITPASVAKKDVEAAAGKFTITGTNFGTDPAKIVVTLTGTGVGALALTGNRLTLTATSIEFNLTAAEAATRVGIALTVKVKKILTATTDEPELTLPTTILVTPAVLQAIAITPNLTSIVKTQLQQFTATGTYDDGTTKVITNDVTWTANHGAFSTTTNGLYTAADAEQTGVTVTAALGAISGTETFNVIASPVDGLFLSESTTYTRTHTNTLTVGRYLTRQIKAWGDHIDDAVQTDQTGAVTWTSSAEAVATVSGGLITALTAGTATITATIQSTDAQNAPVTITKSLTLTVEEPATLVIADAPAQGIAAGATHQFTATATYATATGGTVTNAVVWTVGANDGTFSATTKGLYTAPATFTGTEITYTITGTLAPLAGVTKTIKVFKIPASIAISAPPEAGIAKNATHAFIVTATYADQTTANVTPNVTFTVTPATAGNGTFAAGTGTFTGTASGLCTITAAMGTLTSPAVTMYVYGGDPGIANFTAVRGTNQITLTFTTAYEVKGGVAFLSKKSSFEGSTPILDFQMNILQETGAPTKTHTVVLTPSTVTPAITDNFADYIRVKFAYQLGNDIFETPVTAVP